MMTAGLLSATVKKQALAFDPRTKLLLLVTIAAFVLGGPGGEMEYFRLALSFVPLFFLPAAGKWKTGIGFLLALLSGYLMQMFLAPHTTGILRFLVTAASGLLTRFMPSIMTGLFVMSTTTVSEFVAAMERMHVTEKIVIPMSVLFRFLPTIGEEFAAINDAMRMRGVHFGGGRITDMLEYRLIPMMMCSVKIGDELSTAALTKGLGAPVKRTNICKIGFHIQDMIAIAVCLSVFGMWLLISFKVL